MDDETRMRRVRSAFVSGLETACDWSHPIVHHRPWLWLPFPICPLATLSCSLNERWGLDVWTKPESQ